MEELETTPENRPWEELARLTQTGELDAAVAFLDQLEPEDRVHAFSRLGLEQQVAFVSHVPPDRADDLLRVLPDYHAAEIIACLDPPIAGAIIDEMPSDLGADLLNKVDPDRVEAIYAHMTPEYAEETRNLCLYAENSAGGLMVTEYLVYPRHYTVAQVIQDLRDNVDEYTSYDVQYVYVVDDEERLIGVLRLRDLILARHSTVIETFMLTNPFSVPDTSPLEELETFFHEHAFFGVPTIDADGRLVGIVKRSAVEHAAADRGENQYREALGIVGGEELRSMPTLLRSRRRLAWLVPNILLNIIAASVIAMNTDVIEAVIALAVFLPIISDMSGCSGNQAVAVSIRELTLGVLKPREFLRVWGKEAVVGVINGAVLGLLIGGVALIYTGFFTDEGMNFYLGGVIGIALLVNTLVAVSIGGLVPLLLKGLKVDPALASGPILTTCTDMCGFFLMLTFASMLINQLT